MYSLPRRFEYNINADILGKSLVNILSSDDSKYISFEQLKTWAITLARLGFNAQDIDSIIQYASDDETFRDHFQDFLSVIDYNDITTYQSSDFNAESLSYNSEIRDIVHDMYMMIRSFYISKDSVFISRMQEKYTFVNNPLLRRVKEDLKMSEFPPVLKAEIVYMTIKEIFGIQEGNTYLADAKDIKLLTVFNTISVNTLDSSAVDKLTESYGVDIVKRLFVALRSDFSAVYTSYIDWIGKYDKRKEEGLSAIRVLVNNGVNISNDRIKAYLDLDPALVQSIANIPNISQEEKERIRLEISAYHIRGESAKSYALENAISTNTFNDLRASYRYLRILESTDITTDNATLKRAYARQLNKRQQSIGSLMSSQYSENDLVEFIFKLMDLCDIVCTNTKLSRLIIGERVFFLPQEVVSQLSGRSKISNIAKTLFVHIISDALMKNDPYAFSDLRILQIGQTEDLTGRRRQVMNTQDTMSAMERNIQASASIWKQAIALRNENPEQPVFVIANERTAPSDVAAEAFPKDAAEKIGIIQDVPYDKLFTWMVSQSAQIDSLYERYANGDDVQEEIPKWVLQALGV
jgi:hypothetical protein